MVKNTNSKKLQITWFLQCHVKINVVFQLIYYLLLIGSKRRQNVIIYFKWYQYVGCLGDKNHIFGKLPGSYNHTNFWRYYLTMTKFMVTLAWIATYTLSYEYNNQTKFFSKVKHRQETVLENGFGNIFILFLLLNFLPIHPRPPIFLPVHIYLPIQMTMTDGRVSALSCGLMCNMDNVYQCYVLTNYILYIRAQWLRGRPPDSWLREPGFESCAAVLKLWASFFTLHCSSLLSCINEYLAIDSGGYVYAQPFAH